MGRTRTKPKEHPFERMDAVSKQAADENEMIEREFGGVTINPKNSFVQKLREVKKRIKKGQLKTTDANWLLTRAEDNLMMGLDIITYLDDIREDIHPMQRIALANTYANIHRLIHGDKKTIESKNLNVNIDASELVEKAYAERMKNERTIRANNNVSSVQDVSERFEPEDEARS